MPQYNYENLFGISGQVAVITGAGGILCGEMASALAQLGVKVAVLDLRLQAAEKIVDAIKKDGGQAMAVECNVLEKTSIEKACDTILKNWGTVDILINGAGGNRKDATTSPDLSFFDIPAEAIKFVFDLNIIGSLLPSQVFGKVMAEKKKGSIINISSMNAFRPLTKIPGYSAAKAGISNFTQWLAVHLEQNYSCDIRVNAIAPGFFLTDQNRFLLTDEKTCQLTPRGQCILDHTPMCRFGQPSDLISTLVWLVSPGAAFVNGIVVPVDGGFSAFSGV
ncbi:MAG: SDR family oxidoreductase [Phycisphaerae bacterium]|nr:SDR family oxidoreductase [Phycisphaerae bacterium]